MKLLMLFYNLKTMPTTEISQPGNSSLDYLTDKTIL